MRIARMGGVALAAMILSSCGSGSSPTEPKNLPPTIAFAFAPLGVPKNSTVDLRVTVSDPNPDDNLRVRWTITRGALTALNSSGTQMRWSVPLAIGVDTVTVTVTDGSLVSQVVEELHVGTRVAIDQLDGVWSAQNSPYILAPPSGRMTVMTTATVSPGVTFLFDVAGGGIQVEGTLNALGTASQPVVFRPNDRTLRCQAGRGWWAGIEIRGAGGTATLNHTEVWYGRKNISLRESGQATLRGCVFKCGADAGIQMSSTGVLVVDSCSIDNNASAGISIQSLTALPASVSVTYCYIGINGNAGISLDLRDTGQQVPIRIEYNTFEFNFTHGIFIANQVFPSIHFNHFESNGLSGGLSNLWLQAPYPAPVAVDTLDVTNNYWGGVFSDVSDIDVTIHDRLDDLSIGARAVADPWLNASPVR